jgi:hypothetical protein
VIEPRPSAGVSFQNGCTASTVALGNVCLYPRPHRIACSRQPVGILNSQISGSPPRIGVVKDARSPNEQYNLEEAFIYIDGKRYAAKDLLKLVVEKLR